MTPVSFRAQNSSALGMKQGYIVNEAVVYRIPAPFFVAAERYAVNESMNWEKGRGNLIAISATELLCDDSQIT